MREKNFINYFTVTAAVLYINILLLRTHFAHFLFFQISHVPFFVVVVIIILFPFSKILCITRYVS